MKQIYTHEQLIDIPHSQIEPVNLSFSKYADCLFVFVNQTGSPGSMLEGNIIELGGEVIAPDLEWNQADNLPMYQIKVLFGSSEIQFYEVLFRRILSLIWEQLKVKEHFRVLLNISLPVKSATFKDQNYYQILVESIKGGLMSVL